MEEITNQHLEFVTKLKEFGYTSPIYTDKLRRIAFAHDASFYQLIPQVVVIVANNKQVIQVLQLAYKLNLAVTFRAAGTSLSGQAISNSILLVIDNSWNKYDILDNATKIRMDPGLIAGDANRYLQVYGKKIGPDPSSIMVAKIGGVVANNASGMCCGIAHNSYNTAYAMKLIFANGDELDTANHDSILHFKARNPKIMTEIVKIANKVKQNPELSELIRHKYRLKNTTGYGINALLDFTDPIDIIMHLMVGSEGTLGFISSVSLYTRDSHSNKATALYIFNHIELACSIIQELSVIGVDAVELLDNSSLKSLHGKHILLDFVAKLDANSTGLLIEISELSALELHHKIELCENLFHQITHPQSIKFTTNKTEIAQLWHLRHGLFPSVAALRQDGTTVLIEDISFPLESLALGTQELRGILNSNGYTDAIIFGHVLTGNLHFIFGQNFDDANEVQRYDKLIHAITNLVAIKYNGSLKAEHGTGRNMASFVELEWGKVAYEIMKEIKYLFDPHGILNPDVILSKTPNIHLANLKPMPLVNSIVDKCMECGFCETVCPSKNLSLTPRQRIVVKRYLKQVNNIQLEQEVLKNYEYLGIETCATTGLCALKCPVGINTGTYMLNLKQNSPIESRMAKYIANNFGLTTTVIRNVLSIGNFVGAIIGKKRLYSISRYLNLKTKRNFPIYLPSLYAKRGQFKLDKLQLSVGEYKKVVYFSSCVSRVLDDATNSLINTTRHVLNHFGYSIIMPDLFTMGKNLCCGQSFISGCEMAQMNTKADELFQELIRLSENGKYPICVDTTPCVLQMHTYKKLYPQLKIYDLVEFIHDFVIPEFTLQEIKLNKITSPVALHITCSTKRLGLANKILQVAQLCADNVIVPDDIECCGFAGSKGFFIPELNESALQNLSKQVAMCSKGYSTSKTCELGLSMNSDGVQYNHLIFLLADVLGYNFG